MLVVGDVMLDRYLFGGTSRISPEAPVPVVHVRQNEDRAGGAANVASNLSRLGIKTTLLGVVGDDDEAAALEAYHRARQGDIRSRTFAVDMLNRSLLTGFLPFQALRGVALALAGSLPPLRRVLMRQGLAARS